MEGTVFRPDDALRVLAAGKQIALAHGHGNCGPSFRNDLTDYDLVDLVALNEELQASVGQEIV